jgi:predicted GTPase
MSQSVMSSTASADSAQFRVVHILVMGLTGAGKSTFISKATGDDSIRVGSGLRSGKVAANSQLELLLCERQYQKKLT